MQDFGAYSTFFFKFSNTLLLLFSNKMLVTRAGIHKILVKKANSEDPGQTSALLGLAFFGRQLVSVLKHLLYTILVHSLQISLHSYTVGLPI